MQTKKRIRVCAHVWKTGNHQWLRWRKAPAIAIALQSIHNKVSQQVDSKVILEDCIPHPKSRAGKTFGKLFDLLNLFNNKDYH
ncbi:MAG: hypothetical protein RM368_23405 [Nostoc sp. DedSLP03]|uniref:hypothetical protein n=1 Tax=Nostoc sp. DedSLP03 TaxID=3075400 RepID=UPI002AD38CD2|nr:hypothetical protein [Nostoc sp. DedSLP03]MDZ7967865.1 hypothetical protein [Nostoc sp. DedSLP03]